MSLLRQARTWAILAGFLLLWDYLTPGGTGFGAFLTTAILFAAIVLVLILTAGWVDRVFWRRSRALEVTGLAFDEDGTVVVRNFRGDVTRFDPESGARLRVLNTRTEVAVPIDALDSEPFPTLRSPDGRLLVATDADHRLWVWQTDPEQIKLVVTLGSANSAALPSPVFRPDGAGLAAAGESGVFYWPITAEGDLETPIRLMRGKNAPIGFPYRSAGAAPL
jgi:hypothetical protein